MTTSRRFTLPGSDGTALHSARVTALITEEIRAFQLGFGSPAALLRALRGTTLIVPVDLDLRAVSFHSTVSDAADAGFRWVCGNTTPERSTEFVGAHSGGADWKFVAVTGAYLLGTLLPRFSERTGLFVDPGTEDAMAFPPTTEFMPLAPWAVDLDDA